MPINKGTAGMNADPICSRQAMFPTWYMARFAVKPLVNPGLVTAFLQLLSFNAYMKIPKATHNCHPITKLPRIDAGEFSAANTGIVDAFAPIPIPSNSRHTKN